MRQKFMLEKEPETQVVKNIRRATRRHFLAEDKIRIVLERLRGEDSIAELCRCEGIVQNLYYRWSKDFLEAGKKRLAGDTARAATSDEVKDLRREAAADTGKDRHSARHLLSLVRSVPHRWAASPGRPTAQAGSRLEPHSRRYSRAHHQAGAG
jgi:transposase